MISSEDLYHMTAYFPKGFIKILELENEIKVNIGDVELIVNTNTRKNYAPRRMIFKTTNKWRIEKK